MNIYDLISRAQKLREETKLDSVSPDRVGALCEDTLKFINEYQLLASSPSLHKIYASVSAMQSDSAPKSDLTGKALKPGQLVVIVPASQSDATAGDVYRYDGPSGNTSAWTFVSKIGGVPADAELSATSANPVQNKVVTEKLTELSKEINGYQPKEVVISMPANTGTAYENQLFSEIIPAGSIIVSVTGCTSAVYLMKTITGGTLGDNLYTATLPLTLDYDAYGIKAFAAESVTITYREQGEPVEGIVGDIAHLDERIDKVLMGESYRIVAEDTKANSYAKVYFDAPIEQGSEIVFAATVPYGLVVYPFDENGTLDTTNALSNIRASVPFKTPKKYVGYAANQEGHFALVIKGEIGVHNTRKIVNITTSMSAIDIYKLMLYAFYEGNVDVYFDKGHYVFDNALFSYIKDYMGKESTIGLPIGKGCKYYFNGSTLQMDASDSFAKIPSILDANDSATDFELFDAILINNGGKYCIHDETYGKKASYIHKFHNITLINNGGTMGYGAGTSYDGTYIFENCTFAPGQIVFHAPTNNADNSAISLDIQLRGCVFKDYFFDIGTGYFDKTRDTLRLTMVGCQMKGDMRASTREYFKEIVEYNNDIVE